MAEVVVELLDQIGEPGPVGVTLPSVVLDGVIHTAANIDQGWLGVDADALFQEATGRPVGVVNDADAAGIAEVRFGAGRDQQGVVVRHHPRHRDRQRACSSTATWSRTPSSATSRCTARTPRTGRRSPSRVEDDLSWKEWAHRVEKYLALVERLLWPQLIILGGGVSKKSDKFLPHINLRTEVVPAQLHNDAGIVGAALFAPTSGATVGG